MTDAFRISARREGIIDVSAERAWELLVDWAGTLKWWDNEGAAVRILSVHLEGEHGSVPRTKVMKFANPQDANAPIEFRETLFHEDRQALRCYYTSGDGLMPGFRNYIATTYIDELGPDRCRMTLESTFDIVGQNDPDEARTRIEAAFDSKISGFRKYFRQQDSAGT